MRLGLFVLLLGLGLAPAMPAAADIAGYAIVQDDASLKLRHHRIRLAGIYLPPTGRDCRTNVRPARCASRASLALAFKARGRIVCEGETRNTDGTVTATCRTREVDLAAYLIEMGWAVALPDAPFEYKTLERIARDRGLGIWGFQVDTVR